MINFLVGFDFRNAENILEKQNLMRFLESLRGGFELISVDGAEISSKDSFLINFSKAMRFPDYFGNNWDAFEECITDLSWLEFETLVLFYNKIDSFIKDNAEDFEIAMSILIAASDYWDKRGRPVHIFLTTQGVHPSLYPFEYFWLSKNFLHWKNTSSKNKALFLVVKANEEDTDQQ